MNSRKTRVLAFCLSSIPSALVGVVYPLENISSRGYIEFKFIETLKLKRNDLAEADVIICIRSSEQIEYEIIKECRRLGKYIIYFLDDDLLNIPRTAKSALYFDNPVIKRNIKSIMQTSDCLWTTNINIEKKYSQYFKNSITLHAPALLYDKKEKSVITDKHSKVKIGFAGGIDHSDFLNEILEEPIKRIFELYRDEVEFEFFGAKPKFIDKFNMNFIPHESNYKKYKETIINRGWDIALAPLANTEFHSCKYFNKFLEYGSIGVAAIYSNVEPFTFIVKNGKNGLLADNNTDSWVNCLKQLIDNSDIRKKIADNAEKNIEEMFTTDKVANSIIEQITQITSYLAPHCKDTQVRVLNNNQNYFIFKIINIIKREKFNFLIYLVKKLLEKLKFRN